MNKFYKLFYIIAVWGHDHEKRFTVIEENDRDFGLIDRLLSYSQVRLQV